MLEILRKTDIDFMGSAAGFLFSGIMVVLGIVAVIQVARGRRTSALISREGRGAVEFDQAIRVDEARKALEANGLAEPSCKIRSRRQTTDRLKARRPSRKRFLTGVAVLRRISSNHFVVRFPAWKSDRPSAEASARCPHASSFPLPGSIFLRCGTI